MTVPSNLFIDTPEIEDASLTQLGNDTGSWPEEIITKLKERVPMSATASISIKFMHMDEENGTATGSITITNGIKTVTIPVIVKEFSMYPIDVFMFEGKLLPLNPDYYAQVFADGSESAFGSLLEYPLLSMVDRYTRGENLQNVVFPPNWGRYAFASAVPEGICKDIEKSIDGEVLRKEAQSDMGSLARFHSNGLFDFLNSLSHLKPVNLGEFRQGVDNLIRRNIHVLKHEGPNKYTLLSTAHNNFNPAISSQDSWAARDFFSGICGKPDSLHDLDANGEKVITIIDDTADTTFLAKPVTDTPEIADQFGRYNVRTRTGVNVEGMVVPMVINFDQAPQGTKIFLGKTISTMQPDIVGSRVTTSNWMPEGEVPKAGQTGTFFFHEGEKGGLATLPVTIKSVFTQAPCKMTLRVVDLNGQDLRLDIPLDTEGWMGLQRITRLNPGEAHQHPHYLLPANMKWVAMEGFDQISGSLLDYMSKTASEIKTSSVQLVHTGYDQYSAKGLDKYIEKLSWDKTCLQSHQAKFCLAAVGMSSEKVAEAIKTAKEKGVVEIYNVSFPKLWEEKVAAHMPRAQEMLKTAGQFKHNLFKVASYIENAQTVDALLSLNFVTAENISKFISKIPLFKAAISHLASCLIASRLGVREIPEQSASGAISKLVDVVKGLETLRATQTVGKKGA